VKVGEKPRDPLYSPNTSSHEGRFDVDLERTAEEQKRAKVVKVEDSLRVSSLLSLLWRSGKVRTVDSY
jgi:hypothetical protein